MNNIETMENNADGRNHRKYEKIWKSFYFYLEEYQIMHSGQVPWLLTNALKYYSCLFSA